MQYAVVSDVHLGHRRVPTSHIASSFRKQILSEANSNLDVLFIAGDMFDRLIESNSPEFLMCIELLNDILNYCFKHKIRLRILEGTPSHDNYLNRLFPKLNKTRKHKVDLKYFEILDIEYIEEFGKHILYIPDEWTHDHSLIEQQIEEKLGDYGIIEVDIAILHSQFSYQVLGIPFKGMTYDETYFLSKVKDYIFIGHFHTHSNFDRIYAQGSLERLAHGQEEDKGHMVVRDNKAVFVVNPDAYVFKTLNVVSRTSLKRLDELIYALPKESYVRLNMTRTHPFNLNFNEIKLRYLDYNIERKVSESESEFNSITDIVTGEELEMLDTFIIETDIRGTLDKLVRAKYELTDTELLKLTEHLGVFRNVNSISASE